MPNLKILTFSNSFYFMNVFGIVVSLALMLLSMLYIDRQVSNPHFATMSRALFSPNSLFMILLVVGTTYHLDNVWAKFQGSLA